MAVGPACRRSPKACMRTFRPDSAPSRKQGPGRRRGRLRWLWHLRPARPGHQKPAGKHSHALWHGGLAAAAGGGCASLRPGRGPGVAYGDRSVGRGLHCLAELERVDLLVVGSCRRGPLGRVLCGSDMLAALSGAPCAVAIAPMGYAARAGGLSTIGVGYDGSLESEQGLLVARELAGRHGSAVKVLAVSSLQAIPYGESIPLNWLNPEKRAMAEKLARLGGLPDAEGEVPYGEPKEELAAFAEQLDLLIVGSRSHGHVGRLVNGSVSRYLAERARCPLLVVSRSARKEAEADAGAELVASPA